jgi:NAD(P)-dependent dehydrogenase (short-subunit alcohol dehydrogenase family)
VKVVVFGATGVVGLAAARHFASIPGCEVVGVSRRAPDAEGVRHVALARPASARASTRRRCSAAG